MIVKGSTPEFDYPKGNDNVYAAYDGAAGVAVVARLADSMRLTRSRNAAFSLFKSALFFSRTSSRRKMSDVDCADAGLQATRIAIAATAG